MYEPPPPTTANARPAGAGIRRLSWLLLLVLVVGGFALWSRRGSKPAHSSGPAGAASAGAGEARVVPVVIARAEQRDVPMYLDGLGNATPLATVTVKSQVDGRLDRVLFREGQTVKKGDILAQIDPRPFLIALHQAEAAVMRDTATAQNALRNLERYRALIAQRLIPEQQVTDQQALYDQAQATVASDRTQVENARLQLDYAQIKSPLDGVTGVRLVDPGNIIHASDAGGIVVVTQIDPMAVVFTLPEDDLPSISKELAEGPLEVEAYSRDQGQLMGKGQLLVIDNQVNQATATIKLKALFPNPDRLLWPNGFVKTRLLLRVDKGALVVPATAIQRGPQGTFVYVVTADHKAQPTPVVVASVAEDWAIVGSGIKLGDAVVVEGQNQLRPGAKVAERPSAQVGAGKRMHGPGSSDHRPPGAGGGARR